MHHAQAIVTGGGLFRIKTAAIIADAAIPMAPASCFTSYFHLAGFGMFGNIIERFLANTVERHLHFSRQCALRQSLSQRPECSFFR